MRISKLFTLFTLLIFIWIVYLLLSFYLIVPSARISTQRTIYHSNDDFRIKLTNINGIYLDVNKSAVFYLGENKLLITVLIPRWRHLQRYGLELIVRKNGEILYSNKFKSLGLVSANGYYKFSTIQIDELLFEFGSVSDKLTFQLKIDETLSQEFPINIVDLNQVVNNKAARLIKCSWLPKNRDHIEFIIQLIIEAKYDSIYICVFKQDDQFKSLLNEFNEIQKIQIIELESIPNFMQDQEEFTSYSQIATDPNATKNKGEMLDPVLEFLLNQVYPYLIETYRYVHAGDFDQIIFTSSYDKTFYEELRDIVERNNVGENTSLYFNQYWALENKMSREIFQYVANYFKIDSETADSEIETKKRHFPIYVKVKSLNFDLEINSEGEILYAAKIIEHLRSSISEPMFRYVILKVKHRHVYGQMVHDTRSSLLIKLCTADEYTSRGTNTVIKSPHSIHYRDLYNFRILKAKDNYIPIKKFILWSDYKLNEM